MTLNIADQAKCLLQLKAERELNEKLEWRLRDIQALRDLVVANKGENILHFNFFFFFVRLCIL